MNKEAFLRQIKKQMSFLPDYSVGEEKLLVQQTLGLSKESLFLLQEIADKDAKKVQKYLSKRLNGEPLNKIFKSQNFYGYDFYVNDNVLAPRKETEILVEETLRRIKKLNAPKVLDLCCGSGAIGIAISKQYACDVTLSDISSKALYVARKNAKKLQLKPKFMQKDMLEGNKNLYDIIVCNPPYIKSDDILSLDKGVRDFDPYIALDGGKTGVVFYEYLAKNVRKNLEKEGYVTRERSKEDERVTIVGITKKGNELKDKCKDIPFKVASASVAMSEKETKELYRLLYKFLES